MSIAQVPNSATNNLATCPQLRWDVPVAQDNQAIDEKNLMVSCHRINLLLELHKPTKGLLSRHSVPLNFLAKPLVKLLRVIKLSALRALYEHELAWAANFRRFSYPESRCHLCSPSNASWCAWFLPVPETGVFRKISTGLCIDLYKRWGSW